MKSRLMAKLEGKSSSSLIWDKDVTNASSFPFIIESIKGKLTVRILEFICSLHFA